MKMTGFFLGLVIYSFILLRVTVAEECPIKGASRKEVEVKVTANACIRNNKFEYSYSLYSSPNSKQDLAEFQVEKFSIVANVISPNWYESDYDRQPYFWASISPETNISPGNSLSGFSMESSGLPAIVSYYAAGWISLEQMMVDGDLTAEEEEACADVLDVLKNSVKGKTLGPKDPPAELKPIDFLNYIINLKHEAFTLGWITNKGIEMSLDQKLDAAKKKLEQGQNSTAKNILNALINEVEAQGCETYDNCLKGKHLLPEAYALLKYNVLYLIERL